VHTEQRVKLAGHILRCADNDPRRFATYVQGTGRVKKKGKRRTGRPKINWGDETQESVGENPRGVGFGR